MTLQGRESTVDSLYTTLFNHSSLKLCAKFDVNLLAIFKVIIKKVIGLLFSVHGYIHKQTEFQKSSNKNVVLKIHEQLQRKNISTNL